MVVVVGIDVHKDTHCVVAVDQAGRQVGSHLTVRATDAAAKYQLVRVLRGGAEAALVRASPVALRKVRIVL